MKVYLVHHAQNTSAEEDPARGLSAVGREQADRLGRRLKDAGAEPVRILHSEKRWTSETAERIAAILEAPEETVDYPCATGDAIEPFLEDIKSCPGDIMMAGHVDFLLRTASRLLCGDEDIRIVEFKPGHGTVFCLEGEGSDWTVRYGWRPEHGPG